MSKKQGIILILVGLFFLLLNLNIISRDYIVLFVGLGLLLGNIVNHREYTFVPGLVVTAVGLYNVLNSYYYIHRSVFLVLLGVAFLLSYLLDGTKETWPLYPGFALTFAGAYRYIKDVYDLREYTKLVAPIVLIVVGIIVVIRSLKNKEI
ncbi:hypothetical protein HYG86_02945 [Alkalicella caledoniensis]|uniref:DUF5668 domain-containing protein n=1 Tax=Alkalicella caledoniensis TaxID=2731377 RepID=A0A7G9W529_ALKCA|nr:hypothetical protein [Alkalicella caledoniensis]QNO13791.1 hypothetical protein HYG86_02945 [Alkalicella caledoniensis]